MSWNYRVCKERCKGYDPEIHDPEDEFTYTIHEVYYNNDGGICFTSTDSMGPYGRSKEELMVDFTMMQDAFDKEIIDLDTIVYAEPDHDESDVGC